MPEGRNLWFMRRVSMCVSLTLKRLRAPAPTRTPSWNVDMTSTSRTLVGMKLQRKFRLGHFRFRLIFFILQFCCLHEVRFTWMHPIRTNNTSLFSAHKNNTLSKYILDRPNETSGAHQFLMSCPSRYHSWWMRLFSGCSAVQSPRQVARGPAGFLDHMGQASSTWPVTWCCNMK